MIKAVLHKGFSFTLAILVVLSTLSVTIEKHYCGDKLVDLSVFSSAEKCGMEPSADGKISTKSCCKDTTELINGQDELSKLDSEITKRVNQLFVPALNYIRLAYIEPLSAKTDHFNGYDPPPLIVDNQSNYQVYLI